MKYYNIHWAELYIIERRKTLIGGGHHYEFFDILLQPGKRCYEIDDGQQLIRYPYATQLIPLDSNDNYALNMRYECDNYLIYLYETL